MGVIKIQMKKIKSTSASLILLFAVLGHGSKASTISLQDFNFNVMISGTSFNANLSGVWGTWDDVSSIFTPVSLTWGQGYGYVATDPELLITLNQTDQATGYQIANGSPLALGIYNFPDQSAAGAPGWGNAVSSGLARAVLTDVSWTAPTWTATGNDKEVFFTINTVAKIGEFSFNGGNEVITLIPEPSSASLVTMGVAAMLAFRRRSISSKKMEV